MIRHRYDAFYMTSKPQIIFRTKSLMQIIFMRDSGSAKLAVIDRLHQGIGVDDI